MSVPRSWFARHALLGTLLSVLAACSREAPPPNVLIVSIDTLNRSALRTYDSSAAPLANLERLAVSSAVFEQACTTSSWTLPAHASLMTGRYPNHHGATHRLLRIDPGVATLAQSLRARGYQTVAFTDGGFVDDSFGFDSGFERFNENALDDDARALELPRDGKASPLPGSALFIRSRAFLQQRRRDEPFFAFVHTYALHDYFKVHPWAAERFPERAFQTPEYYSDCLTGVRTGSDEDWRTLRELYRAELEHLDLGLGGLLDELDEQGLSSSTIVMLVSDHGEGLEPEQQHLHHGGRLDEDVIRVPFFVRGPGVIVDRHDDLVSLVDVMPTVLELVGARMPEELDGRSLAPLLRGTGSLQPRPLFAEEHYYVWSNGRRLATRDLRDTPLSVAVIAGRNWYIRGPTGREQVRSRGPRPPDDKARAQLTHLRELADQFANERSTRHRAELDDALTERLNQLGYVER